MNDNERKISRANLIFEAARSVATPSGENRIEEMQLHVSGYAEPGYGPEEIVVTGNWNDVDRYDRATQQRETVDAVPSRMAKLFEKAGIEIEWNDVWTTCDECNKLLRTQPDSYCWKPSFVTNDEGDIACLECVVPEDHLRDLEGRPGTANTLGHINPADHGYVKLGEKYENGLHTGMDADPKLAAYWLEDELGVERYLFNLDETSQFYMTFSVWAHRDALKDAGITTDPCRLDGVKVALAAASLGESVSGRMQAGLQDASAKLAKLKGDGIQMATITGGKASVRLVSREEFIEGMKS